MVEYSQYSTSIITLIITIFDLKKLEVLYLLTYHTHKELEEIDTAINAYEIRNTVWNNNDDVNSDSTITLATGIINEEEIWKSISVYLRLFDLSLVREISCKYYKKAEIKIFKDVKELVMFLHKTSKDQILKSRYLG